MRAIVGTETLSWSQAPEPVLQPSEILVRVRATAVNRADLAQRAGRYPPPPGASTILGLEAAGFIEALGEGVSRWSVGDRVCALLAGGGYAELVAVPQGQLLPVPEGLSWTEAAALPEVLTTAWLNLFLEGGARAGHRVLLHAGASGVGTAAIQICRELGVHCWVTVGSDDKLEFCEQLGARGGCNRNQQLFADLARDWTGGHGFDLVLDPVGAAYLAHDQRVLATGGRLVVIGLLTGRKAELDLGRLMVKRQQVVGSVLRARSVEEKATIIADVRARAWPLVEQGRVKPVIHTIMDIQDVEEAHALVASNTTIGKVVLRVP